MDERVKIGTRARIVESISQVRERRREGGAKMCLVAVEDNNFLYISYFSHRTCSYFYSILSKSCRT